MRPEEVLALAPTPESIGAWEDLLVRLEIVPRVVRNSVEEVTDAGAAADALRAAVAREGAVGRWLEAASGIGSEMRAVGGGPDDAAMGITDLALRFASLRARTFAMVQRRGLEVWGWSSALGDADLAAGAGSGERATAHQLLLWLARSDAGLLAALRQAARARQAAC